MRFTLMIIGGIVLSALIAYALIEINARGIGPRVKDDGEDE